QGWQRQRYGSQRHTAGKSSTGYKGLVFHCRVLTIRFYSVSLSGRKKNRIRVIPCGLLLKDRPQLRTVTHV
ncbi:MAG TPA: hypothetical protein VFW43_00480, partial [Polaromonas sp.]|nr:hypothetical protein [Polaromonas sp.]